MLGNDSNQAEVNDTLIHANCLGVACQGTTLVEHLYIWALPCMKRLGGTWPPMRAHILYDAFEPETDQTQQSV